MQPWPPVSPPRVLRFQEDSKRLELEVQRSQLWLVVQGRYEIPENRSVTGKVLLRSKNRRILAEAFLDSDGTFLIETHWTNKSTIFLEVGEFFVPVIRALDRARSRGRRSKPVEFERRQFRNPI